MSTGTLHHLREGSPLAVVEPQEKPPVYFLIDEPPTVPGDTEPMLQPPYDFDCGCDESSVDELT